MNPRFIDLYNNELRFLRDAGKHFADAYPQVASHLGMREDSVRDPFVERLLEGVAFLTARIQARLDLEHAEFAEQILSRVAPLWNEATPSIATIAFHPDQTSPECQKGHRIPKGSVLHARLPGENRTLSFTTGQDVDLLPLSITEAECSVSTTQLPGRLSAHARKAAGVIRIKLATQGNTRLGAIDTNHLNITFAGDIPLAMALQRAFLADSMAIFACSEMDGELHHIQIDSKDIRVAGASNAEALLPDDAYMLPGLRLLREYFAEPTRLLGVRISGLAKLFRMAPQADSFHLIFLLKNDPSNLVHRVTPQLFRLFATPIINLYPKRLDPVVYDPDKTDQWLSVDRMRPNAHEIHHITEVHAALANGQFVPLTPTPGRTTFDDRIRGGQFHWHRQSQTHATIEPGTLSDRVPARHFLSVELSDEIGTLEDIKSLQVRGYVSDRNWSRDHFDQASFHLSSAFPIQRFECLRLPSEARREPASERHWEAIQFIGSNPLRIRSTGEHDVDGALRRWIELAADPENQGDQRRIASLEKARNRLGFSRSPVAGPMSWVRANRLRLELTTRNHPDGGAWLFSHVIAQALLACVHLNDGLEIETFLDGEPVSQFSNLTHAEGGQS